MTNYQSALSDKLSQSKYIEPRQPKHRRYISIFIIVIVLLGLGISIFIQPFGLDSNEDLPNPIGSFIWIAQVLISFIAVIGSIVDLAGVNVRDLFNTRPAGDSVEAFPFHVFTDYDKIVEYLFPDPTSPILSDKAIPYQPRIDKELDLAFQNNGRVLLCGRSKTGKTREAIELLRRQKHTNPTILVARNHVGLYPPFKIPELLPRQNIILFFDDVDRYLGDSAALKRLTQTISFFSELCHGSGELRIIATARQEEEFWQKLQYAGSRQPWNSFKLLNLQPLPSDHAVEFINTIAGAVGIKIVPLVVEKMAKTNDGTLLNLILTIRNWLTQGLTYVGLEHLDTFEGTLVRTWKQRYRQLSEVEPRIIPIYAAVNILLKLDIPLLPWLIVELATEMSVSNVYFILKGFFHQIRNWAEFSQHMSWFHRKSTRQKIIASILLFFLLSFWLFTYAFQLFIPANFQFDIFQNISDDIKYQVLIISPLLLLILPAIISILLKVYERNIQNQTDSILKQLLVDEVPLRGGELRPYENQFEGNGESRAWSYNNFVGENVDQAFRQIVAHHLCLRYLSWSYELRELGELSSARMLAIIARKLNSDIPSPSFIIGRLWFDEMNFGRALAEFSRCRSQYFSVNIANVDEQIAWCFNGLGDFDQAETAALRALTIMPELTSARWALGISQLLQGNIEHGLRTCQEASLIQSLPSEGKQALRKAINVLENKRWLRKLGNIVGQTDLKPKKKMINILGSNPYFAIVGTFILAAIFLVSIRYFNFLLNEDDGGHFYLQVTNIFEKFYPNSPMIWAGRGYGYQILDEYDKAIENYNQAIHIDPEFAYAYHSRGQTFFLLGNFEQAINDQTIAIQVNPDFSWSYRSRANVYFELGEYQRAIADYSKAIEHDPQDDWSYIGRGTVYLELGEYQHANADYSKAIEIDPQKDISYFGRGLTNSEFDKPLQAISDISKAIEIDPQNKHFYSFRGEIYFDLEEFEGYIANYSEAIQNNPDEAWPYEYRCDAYSKIEKYDSALADCSEAIRLNPDYGSYYHQRGKIYFKLEEFDNYIANYTDAIQNNPDEAWPYEYRCDAYSKIEKYDSALADCSEAIRLNPDYGSYYHQRGKIYFKLEEFDNYIANYTDAIQNNPDEAWPHAYRCYAYSKIEKYDSALADCNTAIIVEDTDWAHFHRANVYQQLDEYKHAITDISKAIEIDPQNKYFYSFRGEIYFDLEEFDNYIANFTEAIQNNPDEAWPYEYRCDAYSKIEKYDSALADCSEAIRLNPDYGSYYHQRGKIYFKLEEFDNYIANYTDAIQNNPDEAWPYENRCYAYSKIEKYDSALNDCNTAINIDIDSSVAYEYRGYINFKLENYELAIIDLNEAVKIFPNFPSTYNLLGKVYYTLKYYDDSILNFSIAIELNSEYAKAYENRGFVFHEIGDSLQATADWDQAINLYEETDEQESLLNLLERIDKLK